MDSVRGQYDQIYQFPTHAEYTIKAVANRILITSTNSTPFQNQYNWTQYFVNQTLYFFLDDPTNGLTLMASSTVRGIGWSSRLEVYSSPQLTKLGFGYIPLNSNDTVVVSKTVDYANLQVNDLTPKDFTRFMTTMTGSQPRHFDFSDYYMVARNDSNLQNNPSGQPVEEAFQFVGNQIVSFRSRNLSGDTELNKFARIAVDTFYPNELVVLNTYKVIDNSTNNTVGFQVVEYDYGSLASMSIIIPQAPPPFLNFTVPTSTSSITSPTLFEWAYFNVNGSASTTSIYLFRANSSAPSNLVTETYLVNGSWSYVIHNPQCSLLKSSNNSYFLYYRLNNNNYTLLADLT